MQTFNWRPGRPLAYAAFDELPVRDKLLHVYYRGAFVSADLEDQAAYYCVDRYFVQVRAREDRLALFSITAFRKGELYEQMVDCASTPQYQEAPAAFSALVLPLLLFLAKHPFPAVPM